MMIRTFKELKATDVQLAAFMIMTQLMFFLIILLQAAYSNIQSKSVFSIGGYVLGRLREEMTDQLYGKGSWLQKFRPILLLMNIRNGKSSNF